MQVIKKSLWVGLVFPVLSLTSCDGIKDKLTNLLESSLSEAKSSTGAAAYSGERVSHLSAADFEAFTQTPGRLVVVDFYADWCGPCRKLTPILQRVVDEHGGLVLLGKVDVDAEPKLASEQGVRGIPDVRIYKNGKQVDRFVGLPPEQELLDKIESQLSGLSLPDEPTEGTASSEPEGDAEAQPTTQPMSKDWLPPGMKRR